MLEREEDVVVHLCSRPQLPHLGVHRASRPEQRKRLVDRVRTQVEQHPTGVLRRTGLAPLADVDLRAPALKARLEPAQVSQRTVLDEAPQGEEVAVPAPVVEDAGHNAPLGRRGSQPLAMLGCCRQGLVDHKVEAGLDRRHSEGEMCAVGCRDDHKIVVGRVR